MVGLHGIDRWMDFWDRCRCAIAISQLELLRRCTKGARKVHGICADLRWAQIRKFGFILISANADGCARFDRSALGVGVGLLR